MEFEENMINNRPATQAVMERDELILREQNALKIFNKNIIPWWDRFEQALNPNNQKEMTLYSNFVFKNLDIPKTLIWEQLENLKYVVSTISKSKPTSVKGTFVQGISISSTMGPGIKVDKNSFDF